MTGVQIQCLKLLHICLFYEFPMAQARRIGKALIFIHYSHRKQSSFSSVGAQPPELGPFRSSHKGPQWVQWLLTRAMTFLEMLVVRRAAHRWGVLNNFANGGNFLTYLVSQLDYFYAFSISSLPLSSHILEFTMLPWGKCVRCLL